MEFSFRILVVIVLGLIAIVILVGIMYSLSGESKGVTEWLIDSIKKAISIDFGPKK